MPAATLRVVGLIGLTLASLVSACTDSAAKNYDPSADGQSPAHQAACFYEYCNVATATNYLAVSMQHTAVRTAHERPLLCHLFIPKIACRLASGSLVQTVLTYCMTVCCLAIGA